MNIFFNYNQWVIEIEFMFNKYFLQVFNLTTQHIHR